MPERTAWDKLKDDILDKLRADPSLVYGGLVQKGRTSTPGWVSVLCPLHDDAPNPSAGWNKNSLRFFCFGGCGGGSVFDFLMQTRGIPTFRDAVLEAAKIAGVEVPKEVEKKKLGRPPVPEKLVDDLHAALLAAPERLAWLREHRGITERTVGLVKVGWDERKRRYTLPVRDEHGVLVNVRKYRPDAKGDSPKMIHHVSEDGHHRYGSPARLFGVGGISRAKAGSTVLVGEGELDAVLAWQEAGLAACTSTHGGGTFRPDWVPLFKGKHVALVVDADERGRGFVEKVLLPVFREAVLKGEVLSVKDVRLPLSGEKGEKDLTDWIVKKGGTGEGLCELVEATAADVGPAQATLAEIPPGPPAGEPPGTSGDAPTREPCADGTTRLGSFAEIDDDRLIGRTVTCELTVSGERDKTYHAPRTFQVEHCAKMETGKCHLCRGVVHELVPELHAREIVGACFASDAQVVMMLRDVCCPYQQRAKIKVLERRVVREFRAQRRVQRRNLSLVGRSGEDVAQTIADGSPVKAAEKSIFLLRDEPVDQTDYEVVGTVTSTPRTQVATLLVEEMRKIKDDYESWSLDENLHLLRRLKDAGSERMIGSLRDNVTRIYKRDHMLAGVLLTLLAPRWLRYRGELIRGWLCTAIVGDSGTGKSQTWKNLTDWLQVGDTVSGLTSSRTGIVYGIDREVDGGGSFVRAGRHATNSGKALCVDEADKCDPEDIVTMGKAMDEGYVQVDRIASKGFRCETRLLLLANPSEDAVMDDYGYGCSTLKHVLPNFVIRRLDLALFLNRKDVSGVHALRAKLPELDEVVTAEAVRSLMYWAWRLTPDSVHFEPGTEDACARLGSELVDRFGHAPDVPLVTDGGIDKTLARLAAAGAVLDFGADDDFRELRVTPDHVEGACSLLKWSYDADSCMLGEYSSIMRGRNEMADDEYAKITSAINAATLREKHSSDGELLTQKVLTTLANSGVGEDSRRARIRRSDIVSALGCRPETVSRKVNLLRSLGLVETGRGGYRKLPKFQLLVNRLKRERSDLLAVSFDRPEEGDGDLFAPPEERGTA